MCSAVLAAAAELSNRPQKNYSGAGGGVCAAKFVFVSSCRKASTFLLFPIIVEIAADELAPRSKLEDILMSMMIWDASEENKSDYEKIVRVVAC